MKKNVTLLMVCLMALVFTLTGCGASTSEVSALRQQVADLEEQVDELEGKQILYEEMISNLQADMTKDASEEVAELSEEVGKNEECREEKSEEEIQNLMEYLDKQINSNKVENWIEVAECEYATEDHLKQIAQKCVTINYYEGYYSHAEKGQNELADAIMNNSAITDEVLRELLNSQYESIWLKVITSPKCSEITLYEVASKCVKIDYYEGYYSHAEKGQMLFADEILKSRVLTDSVVRKLLDSEFPSIWFKALESDKCSEETLILAAQKCVAINYYEGYYSHAENGQLAMANLILENPALTENVLKEFANSEYSSVVSLGHQNIETAQK